MLLAGLLFLLPASIVADKMSWCDYWYRRGIARQECARPRQQHWSLMKKENKHDSNVLAMPICDMVTDWGKCQKADHCPLGLLCWVNGNPCCTPQRTNNYIRSIASVGHETCPVPQLLGIQCNVKNTVSWCNVDTDCHRHGSPQQKCCPSGCGYNLCIRTGPSIDMNARLAAMSVVPPQCPRMDALNIACTRDSGTSWCNSDSDCYNNSAQKRTCCPTRCGYNVCVLQLNKDQWIIA